MGNSKTVRIVRAIGALAGVVLTFWLLSSAVVLLDGWVGAAVLLGVLVLAALVVALSRRRVAKGTVLEIDLERGVVEKIGSDPVSRALNRNAVAVRDVVDALHRAADDKRITGLVVRLGNGGVELAHAQELRDAVHHFRGSSKTAIAFAETFGEGGDATVDYYLATAFQKVYLQPMGGASVQGRLARARFIRGALDKLGIHPDFDHRKEYKSAKYMLTETQFTAPHREALGAMAEDHLTQIVEGIATDRELDQAVVRAVIDRAPLTSSEAVSVGLVDELGYRDEAYEAAGGDRMLFYDKYLKKAGRPHRKGDRIALIYGTGSIARGSSGFDPLTQGASMGADDVAAAFRKAIDDDKVEAVVFRVDSPGGSAVASEVIRREVVRARDSGRPVVVSMGNVAGSGGYWISANADRIVAQPGTITGSIGVVGGKLATRDAWGRIGITFDQLRLGQNAGFWSSHDKYTDGEREILQTALDDIYDQFTSLVSEGRAIDREDVEDIAKGRIWSGARAKVNGLVDELGGLETAVGLARELAGVAPDRAVQLRVYPEERTLPIPRRKESSEPIELAFGMLADLVRGLKAAGSGVSARMPF